MIIKTNSHELCNVDVNFKTDTLVTLLTNNCSDKWIIESIYIQLTDGTTISVQPIISVGTNNSTYDNISNSKTLNLTTNTTIEKIALENPMALLAEDDILKLSIETNATADTYTGKIIIIATRLS